MIRHAPLPTRTKPGLAGILQQFATRAVGLRNSLAATVLVPALRWWRIYTFFLGAIIGMMLFFLLRRDARA